MKLPQIPQDKANHFIYGFAIFFLANLFLLNYIALEITIIFALSKEVYDEWDYGGFDWKDLLVTLVPPLILTLYETLVLHL